MTIRIDDRYRELAQAKLVPVGLLAQLVMDVLVSIAMLVVMGTLTPAERVALVLHDVFDFPFGWIAEVLGSTPAASRKLASRARARVAAVQERPRASRAETERALKAFEAAADAGDFAEFVGLLDPEAVLVADGGGNVTAARRPVRGTETIALLAVRQIKNGRITGFRRPTTQQPTPHRVGGRHHPAATTSISTSQSLTRVSATIAVVGTTRPLRAATRATMFASA